MSVVSDVRDETYRRLGARFAVVWTWQALYSVSVGPGSMMPWLDWIIMVRAVVCLSSYSCE
jgi:hypothetical protein